MKTDRLIAITLYLLNRETVSASALAARFEVSKRTIQRDVEALNQAGIPIVSTYGAGGGYAIMGGFRLAKQPVTADDLLNITAALKGLSTAYPSERVDDTLKKALAARQDAEQRIFVDISAARERGQVNARLKTVEQAIRAQRPLRIAYTNAENATSERVVEPLALSYRWYAWYLLAFCTVRQDYRLFKLARIARCEPLDTPITKAHGDVEALLSAVGRADGQALHVRLLCKGAIRRQALEYIGSNVVEERPDGDFVLAFDAPLERMWFSLLLGFGDQVKVLEPPELIPLLKQRAQEIMSLY